MKAENMIWIAAAVIAGALVNRYVLRPMLSRIAA